MGLTTQSTGNNSMEKELNIVKASPADKIVALGGNPNVGKSTIFNNLTGMKQHTGNWPGKTVTNAKGLYKYKDNNFILVDIPGTYSLMANSVEEEVARDFICFGNPDATIIVIDATCVERNLNLVLQTLEITDNVIVCVNLMDEARRKGISVDLVKLSFILGVPVIGTCASTGEGLMELMDATYRVSNGNSVLKPYKIKYSDVIEKSVASLDSLVSSFLTKNNANTIDSRWLSLKLLEDDSTLINTIHHYLGFNIEAMPEIQAEIKKMCIRDRLPHLQ